MKEFWAKLFLATFGMVIAGHLADKAIATHEAIKYNEKVVDWIEAAGKLSANSAYNVEGKLPALATVKSNNKKEG